MTHLPKSKLMRDAVRRLDRDKAQVDFVKRYSDLYGMYTETEVVYTDDRTFALYASLSEQDKAMFPFDAAMIDWKYYLKDVHSPAVTQSLRELSRRDRDRPKVQIREREQPVVAVFDMEGTIITSNVVESYVWTRMADLRARRVAKGARERLQPDPRLPADRSARPRRFPADVLPPLRRRERRGDRSPGGGSRRRVHAAEDERGLDPAGARASRGGASHDPDHRGGGAVRAAARAAVRRGDRRRAAGEGRALHGLYVAATAGRARRGPHG